MRLQELKEFFMSFPDETKFNFKISSPFCWRGSYEEVCFSIDESPSTVEENLANINEAYKGTYEGYKGGTYIFDDATKVNFEESNRSYTDGTYANYLLLNALFQE